VANSRQTIVTQFISRRILTNTMAALADNVGHLTEKKWLLITRYHAGARVF